MKTNYSITLSAKNADNTKSIIASLSDNREIVASTVFAQIIHIASTIFANRLMLGGAYNVNRDDKERILNALYDIEKLLKKYE